MDIKWKDENGNILNANDERIIYLDAKNNIKTMLKKEEIKKITIVDGMMNLFRDFEHDLAITIIIPKKSTRNAVKIYNKYDKTGKMLKKESSHFLLNLIIESSLAFGTPFLGMGAVIFSALFAFNMLGYFMEPILGDIWIILVRLIVFGYPTYILLSYIFTKVKRKQIKEI